MKNTLFATLLAGLAALSTPAFAQDDGGRPARKASPVKVEMKKLDKALDAVGDFLKKPEGDAPMAQIAAAQMALQEAKKHAPRTTQGQPEDKQAAWVAAYKVEINKTIRMLLDLEDAMLTKDWAAAGKAVKMLGEQKKSGHKTYKGRRRRRGSGAGGR